MKTFRFYFMASGYMDIEADSEEEAVELFEEEDIDTGDLGEVDSYDIEELEEEEE